MSHYSHSTAHSLLGKIVSAWLILLGGLIIGLVFGYAWKGRHPSSPIPDRGTESSKSTTPTGNTAPGGRKVQYWRSPMDPNFIRNAPGKDNMGMDLVPVYADESQGGPSIRIDPVTEQGMGVRYDVVRKGPLARTIRTVGIVKYNETGLGMVTTRVNGWVQKLYVSQTGVQVHEGDPLFDFYSPQLYSAQEELLVTLRSARTGGGAAAPGGGMAQSRLESARDRLRLYDISEDQIQELERDQKIHKSMVIKAKLTGIVTDKAVTEGQYLDAGMMAYKIADLSTVWVIGRVFEADTQYLRLGQEAHMTLDYLPGRVWRGHVTYIYPYLEEGTRELPVRMEFHNPGYALKPGMYATIEIQSRLADQAVLVPALAVINTGMRQVAYVMREPGKFEPRELKIGVRSGANELQILSGLQPGEKVVVSGQFLIDSEASLREASLKMLKAGQANTQKIFRSDGRTSPSGAMHMNGATSGSAPMSMPGMNMPTSGSSTMIMPGMGPMPGPEQGPVHGTAATTQTAAPKYVCPMPAHAGILYDHPGNCPLCGMKLVPAPDWQAASSPIAYYTCPMPEHSDIHEPRPGKCPRCGMTLIPVTEEDARRFAQTRPEDRPSTSTTNRPRMAPMPGMEDMPGMDETPGMRMDRATSGTAPKAK